MQYKHYYQKTGLTQKTVSSHTLFSMEKRTVPLVHFADYFLCIIHLSYSNPQYLFVRFLPQLLHSVEMAEARSPARKKPPKVYAVMALAPWIGTVWRYLSVYTPIPT